MRDRLIELFYDNNVHCDQKIEELADDVMDTITESVTVQEWISVKGRLPEESGKYLVFGRTFGNKKPQIWICECISIGRVMGWCNSAKNPVVTHWMPLPQPPKGE